MSSVEPSKIVYVNSNSDDGSVSYVRQNNINVVELDPAIPMNMARGRNAGFQYPNIGFIQFVDGDCELESDWLETARQYMVKNPNVAIVSGRRTEKYPEVSIYNRLADIEWDTPIGDAKYCHGDAMFRVGAFKQTGGFNRTLICGEEPELCIRIKLNDWEIKRIDHAMTTHDADMHRFSQWWTRNIRSGWAFAQGMSLHGNKPQRHWVREAVNNWIYGLLLPLVAIITIPITMGFSLLVLLFVYIYHFARMLIYARAKNQSFSIAEKYAFFITLGKISNAIGQIKYCFAMHKRNALIIDYKT